MVIQAAKEADDEETIAERQVERAAALTSPLFISGVFITLLGIAMALGVWLHDAAKLPFGGSNYTNYGFLDMIIIVLGLALFAVGLVVVEYSMRKLSRQSAASETAGVSEKKTA